VAKRQWVDGQHAPIDTEYHDVALDMAEKCISQKHENSFMDKQVVTTNKWDKKRAKQEKTPRLYGGTSLRSNNPNKHRTRQHTSLWNFPDKNQEFSQKKMPVCGAGSECRFPNLPLGSKQHQCFYCGTLLHGPCVLDRDLPGRPQREQDVCPGCNESKGLGLKKAPAANHEEQQGAQKRKQPSIIDISSSESPSETISTLGEESSSMESKKQRTATNTKQAPLASKQQTQPRMSSFFAAAKKSSTKMKKSSSRSNSEKADTQSGTNQPSKKQAPVSKKKPPPQVQSTSAASLASTENSGSAQSHSAPLASPASTDKSGGAHARGSLRAHVTERLKVYHSKTKLIVNGIDITVMKNEEMKPNVIPPSSKKKAVWWRAFSIMMNDGSSSNVAVCNCCCATVRLSKDLSPTPLKTHLETNHRPIYRYLLDIDRGIKNHEIRVVNDEKQSAVEDYMEEHDDKRTKKEKREDATRAARRATALWVAATDQPLNASSNEHFRAMQAAVATAAKQQAPYETGKDSIGDELAQLATEARRVLMALMKGQAVSITGDHWTSRGGENYACMTAHWIDDECKLESAVLRVYVYHGSTCAINLVEDFVAQLEYWGLSLQQVPFVVTDTEAKMNAFGVKLVGRNVAHLYCIDHVLQLVAKIASTSLLKVDTPTDDDDDDDDIFPNGTKDTRPAILKQCHRLIEHFTSSTQATEKLNTIQRVSLNKAPLQVIQDVITRWWSTYAMVERLFELKVALQLYDDEQNFERVNSRAKIKARMLTKKEWIALEHLKTVLKPFKLAQQFLEQEKNVTISFIPFILDTIRDELTNVVEVANTEMNTSVVACGTAMLESFETHFGGPGDPVFNKKPVRGDRQRQVGVHPAVIFAHALDPRFKALKIIPSVEREGVWDALVDEVLKSANFSAGGDKGTTGSSNHDASGDKDKTTPNNDDPLATPPPPKQKKKTNAFFEATPIKKHLRRLQADSDTETDMPLVPDVLREQVTLELKQYKSHRPIKIDENPLTWWAEWRHVMPLIWKYARIVLAIPATSAPSERAFSSAGNLVTQKRSRLGGDKVEEILMVKENMHRLK
jgi:zinc finger BED domain-containing protein 1 (E3 SUMO-protein ligase ZBED1)